MDISGGTSRHCDVEATEADQNETEYAVRDSELRADGSWGGDRGGGRGCFRDHSQLSRWLLLGGASGKEKYSISSHLSKWPHLTLEVLGVCRFFY